MSRIIQFKDTLQTRRDYKFLVRTVPVMVDGSSVRFPCIALYHTESGVPVAYPHYERFLFRLNKPQSSETMLKTAYSLANFLNHILWNTTVEKIRDCTLEILRGWIVEYRTCEDAPRDPVEWKKGISAVFQFLVAFQECSPGLQFHYEASDLVDRKNIPSNNSGRKRPFYKQVVEAPNLMFVKPPRKTSRKNRLLLHGHMEMLLYEARKYDPVIALGIALQAYAGLREGEIVNLTQQSSISQVAGGFGRISKVRIALENEAGFALSYTGKKEFGSIKRYRVQEVYPDFIPAVLSLLREHENLLRGSGYDTEPDAPLFYNKHGNPMTVDCYTGRIKSLFYKHFLPDLKVVCEKQNAWAENAPYIDAYEKEYPGAHMFRHWFTMYLLLRTDLRTEEISKWRGDSSIDAMEDYIHVNAEFIRAYKNSVFYFQQSLLEVMV